MNNQQSSMKPSPVGLSGKSGLTPPNPRSHFVSRVLESAGAEKRRCAQQFGTETAAPAKNPFDRSS